MLWQNLLLLLIFNPILKHVLRRLKENELPPNALEAYEPGKSRCINAAAAHFGAWRRSIKSAVVKAKCKVLSGIAPLIKLLTKFRRSGLIYWVEFLDPFDMASTTKASSDQRITSLPCFVNRATVSCLC